MRKRFSMLLTAAALVLGLYSCSSSDDERGGKDAAPAYVKAYKASEILVYVGMTPLRTVSRGPCQPV